MSNICNIILLELKNCSSFLLIGKNTPIKYFKIRSFFSIYLALWEDDRWPWSFILTLVCHSQTYLDLFAFVIANTFPVISTSQNCVTLSTIKQWGSFFFSILKKDFWHRLRHLENCCHWKWKKRRHKGRSIFRAAVSFQRTDSRNCSFCEIK